MSLGFFWTDVADEICVSDFLVFGNLVFYCENIVPVFFIQSALGLVLPMPLKNMLNSFASKRVLVVPLGPATSLLVLPCLPEPPVKC